ncbi:MAG: hypothetical protein HFH75_14670 [Lachnospiraceae bacterium]|nr:hypothetical protein [Lachnospiraceae bacterium]
MYINQIFELSMTLNNENFQKVLNKAYRRTDYLEENENEYIDRSLLSKGITVVYHNSQYKKKVKLIVDSGLIAGGKSSDPDRLIRKLDKHMNEYFNYKHRLNDFVLSGAVLDVNIDVHDHENVSAYLKVLRRIGKVKGYSQADYDCFEEVDCFCLEGNSNDTAFWLYDLEGFLMHQLHNEDIDRKKLKSICSDAKGIIRTEVRLMKPKAVRACTKGDDISSQIVELIEKRREIFLDIFTHIIPFGDYYKKAGAEELIYKNVTDSVLRRQMLRLLALIPEKKSLYLAQKAMKCRNIERVMGEFAKINVSPVTISKRHDVKCLKNLYSF